MVASLRSRVLFRSTSALTMRSTSFGWSFAAFGVATGLIISEYVGPITALTFVVGIAVILSILLWDDFERWNPVDTLPLIAIFSIGILGMIFTAAQNKAIETADLQRDLGIILSYSLFLAIGQMAASNAEARKKILLALVFSGTAISVVHLFLLITTLANGFTDLNQLRLQAGRGSFTEFSALMSTMILLRDRRRESKAFSYWLYSAAVLVVISVISSLSRGLLLSLLFLTFIVVCVRVSRRSRLLSLFGVDGVLMISTTIFALWIIYLIIGYTSPAVVNFIDEYFVRKLLDSWTEVSSVNFNTRSQVSANYRAFESNRAMAQFDRSNFATKVFGQGWGTVVTFGTETAASTADFSRTQAAFLHNGYFYFLTKSGVIGLFLYVTFLVRIAWYAIVGRVPASQHGLLPLDRQVLLVAVLALAVGTYTTGGFGYPVSYLGVALMIGFCSRSTRREDLEPIVTEGRDTRAKS